MTTEERVSEQLRDLAGTVVTASYSADSINRSVRRRRRGNQAVITAASVVAVVGVVFAVSQAIPGTRISTTPRGGETVGATSGGPRPSPATGPDSRNNLPVQSVNPQCGGTLGMPTVEKADHGISIRPGTVTMGPDGAPVVSLRVVAEEKVDVTAPLSPMLVVLDAGRVVALSKPVDNTPAGVPAVSMFVAAKYRLDPQHAYPVTVEGNTSPCGGVSWNEIRDAPARYTAMAILPVRELIWGVAGPADWLTVPVSLG